MVANLGRCDVFRPGRLGWVNHMSAKLIYHTPESCLGGVSPFDAAVTEMIDGHDVAIACPYLGLTYLQRIIDGSERWRVLTDVEEWLASHGGAS